MNAWTRWVSISICSFAAGCGGGGGGSGMSTTTMNGDTQTTSSSGPTMPVVPDAILNLQGRYFGPGDDTPQDPSNGASIEVIITPDGRILAYIEDVPSTPLRFTVIDGKLDLSGTDVVISEATAFSRMEPDQAAAFSRTASGQGAQRSSGPATGVLRLNPDQFTDLGGQLVFDGRTFDIMLNSDPDYLIPSSLESIQGDYGQSSDQSQTPLLKIDSAGNIIAMQGALGLGCSGMGRITADMPMVNAYTFDLQVDGCMDSSLLGTYTGRVSLDRDELDSSEPPVIVGIAHSDRNPIFDFFFDKLN